MIGYLRNIALRISFSDFLPEFQPSNPSCFEKAGKKLSAGLQPVLFY